MVQFEGCPFYQMGPPWAPSILKGVPWNRDENDSIFQGVASKHTLVLNWIWRFVIKIRGGGFLWERRLGSQCRWWQTDKIFFIPQPSQGVLPIWGCAFVWRTYITIAILKSFNIEKKNRTFSHFLVIEVIFSSHF